MKSARQIARLEKKGLKQHHQVAAINELLPEYYTA